MIEMIATARSTTCTRSMPFARILVGPRRDAIFSGAGRGAADASTTLAAEPGICPHHLTRTEVTDVALRPFHAEWHRRTQVRNWLSAAANRASAGRDSR